jgi:AAA15 family ATPase/GTPase
MIISFALENWMSFRDPVRFSMVAGKERQHRERVPRVAKYPTSILPISLIYGGNAAGKTNFFAALNFARSMVVRGTQPDSLIGVEPFSLGGPGAMQPSRFVFELLIDETVYEYGFTLTRKEILEERLVLVTSSSEKVLFEREGASIRFDASLVKDQALKFAFRGTRDNQLFLTNAVSQKIDHFRPVYDWFKDRLELVAPDARFEPFEQFLDEGHPLYGTMNDLLAQLDTGILRLGGEVIPLENLPLPVPLKTQLLEDVKEGSTLRFTAEPGHERFVITRRNGELTARKLVAYHATAAGGEARFDMRHESDGSQRVIDLLPAFLELAQPGANKVFVIDEFDRSLHSLLTRKLLETYLASCSPTSRSQLLLTTHDLLLMDQSLLRRDEMWVAERGVDGASSLVAFSEYKDVRYDKDIRKSYLQGRMGGVPRLILGGSLDSGLGSRAGRG